MSKSTPKGLWWNDRQRQVRRGDLIGQVCERWQVEFLESTSAAARERLIDSWLADVRRRGAKLYSVKRSRAVLYLSVQGKDRLRYSVKIDLHNQDIRIELNRSEWKWVKCERYLLDPGSLRLLAKRICPLPEGQAAVAADLLARLLLLCDAYRRMLHEQELEQHTQVSTESIWKMESELRQYLIPEEQRSTNNPFLLVSPRP